jgi:Ca-activated chloride channel family protein
MNWAEPWWLAALSAVVALAALTVLAGRAHFQALSRVFRGAILARVLPGSVRRRRRWRTVAGLVGLACCIVALAEPRFDKQLTTIEAKGSDLVLAVDLSRSMDARDVDPSRIERARREISDLTAQLAGDRVGLVVFAGGAVPRLPMTMDYGALNAVLGEIHTSDFQAQGSDLPGAIEKSLDLLTRDESPAGKAIILFSDGEVFDPDAVGKAAAKAAAAHVPIYAVGIGTDPAPIPVEGGGFLNWKGQQVTSTPDPATLQELARATGGAYVQSVASADDMNGLVSELRRSLTAVVRQQQQRETWQSAFQLPLGLGAALLLFSGWLGDGRAVLGVLALLGAALGSPRAQAADLTDADQAYRAGNYKQAVRELEELSLEDPSNAEVHERLAAARYRAGDFEGAARDWDAAGQLRGGEDATDAYNAANAHYQAGRLERARDLYDQVLKEDPNNKDAAANKEKLEKELAERMKQQPPPPPKSGDQQQPPKDGGEDQQQPDPKQSDQQQQQQDQSQGSPDQKDSQQADQRGSQQQADQQQPKPGDQGTPSMDDLAKDGNQADDQKQAAAGDQPADDGAPISAAQAERLLDSVKEGQPGYTYGGPRGGKPW